MPVLDCVSQSYLIGQKNRDSLSLEMHELRFSPRKVICTLKNLENWNFENLWVFWSLVQSQVKKLVLVKVYVTWDSTHARWGWATKMNYITPCFFLFYYKQECIPVRCVPPACRSYVWCLRLAVCGGRHGGSVVWARGAWSQGVWSWGGRGMVQPMHRMTDICENNSVFGR